MGGKLAPKCIPKSIDRSIPLPIACKCHFEATLELQKASKSASVLGRNMLSTVAAKHRGISEICAFPQENSVFYSIAMAPLSKKNSTRSSATRVMFSKFLGAAGPSQKILKNLKSLPWGLNLFKDSARVPSMGFAVVWS